jgi:hypothetical protein
MSRRHVAVKKSSLRGIAQHDIEPGGQLAGARLLAPGEIGHPQVAGRRLAHGQRTLALDRYCAAVPLARAKYSRHGVQ